MIIECPSCGVKYAVPDGSIAAEGRRVRCAACRNTWLAHTEHVPAAEPVEVMFEEFPLSSHEMPLAETHAEAEEPALRGGDSDPVLAAPVAALEDKSESRLAARIAAVFVLLAFLGGLAAALALFKDKIEAAWPPAQRFYAAIGLPPVQPVGAGLAFREVHAMLEPGGDGKALKIEGSLTNITSVPRPVPTLRAVLAKDGQTVKTLDFPSGVAVLPAAGVAKFAASFDSSFDGAEAGNGNVLLTFSPENSAEMK